MNITFFQCRLYWKKLSNILCNFSYAAACYLKPKMRLTFVMDSLVISFTWLNTELLSVFYSNIFQSKFRITFNKYFIVRLKFILCKHTTDGTTQMNECGK